MDFQVGDRVRVLARAVTRTDLHHQEGMVVEVRPDDEVKVVLPLANIIGHASDFGWLFSRASSRLEKIGDAKPVSSEGPCRQCGRKNDLTAKTCWWCCVAPF